MKLGGGGDPEDSGSGLVRSHMISELWAKGSRGKKTSEWIAALARNRSSHDFPKWMGGSNFGLSGVLVDEAYSRG